MTDDECVMTTNVFDGECGCLECREERADAEAAMYRYEVLGVEE